MSTNNPTATFNQAINESWNLETDWLWLANQMSLIEQQTVCLKRALHINPSNAETSRRLKSLQRKMNKEQSRSFGLLIRQLAKQLSN
jgi:hypothetical protein